MPRPILFPQLRDPEWLRVHYVETHATLDEVARELGTTGVTVLKALRRAGITPRTSIEQRIQRGTTARPHEFSELHDCSWLTNNYGNTNRTVSTTAAIIGCTQAAVRKALRECGIEIRPEIKRIFKGHSTDRLSDRDWLKHQRLTLHRPVADMAAELGCSIDAVTKALWRNGIRMRDPLPRGTALDTAELRLQRRSTGYVAAWAPTHPAATMRGMVQHHRLVAEAALGRLLRKGEVVHHLNINPGDNRVDNFIVFPSNAIHMSFHANPSTWVPRCKCCGKPNPESMTGRPANVPLLYTDWPDVLKP